MEARPIDTPVSLDLEKLDEEVKKKNPGKKLYHIEVPHLGHFYFRGQDMADVKFITSEVDAYVEQRVKELGGDEAINNLPPEERTKLARETDIEAGERSNLLVLKRCVVHPENFPQMLEGDEVMSGLIPLLLDHIMDVSGWVDVKLREV